MDNLMIVCFRLLIAIAFGASTLYATAPIHTSAFDRHFQVNQNTIAEVDVDENGNSFNPRVIEERFLVDKIKNILITDNDKIVIFTENSVGLQKLIVKYGLTLQADIQRIGLEIFADEANFISMVSIDDNVFVLTTDALWTINLVTKKVERITISAPAQITKMIVVGQYLVYHMTDGTLWSLDTETLPSLRITSIGKGWGSPCDLVAVSNTNFVVKSPLFRQLQLKAAASNKGNQNAGIYERGMKVDNVQLFDSEGMLFALPILDYQKSAAEIVEGRAYSKVYDIPMYWNLPQKDDNLLVELKIIPDASAPFRWSYRDVNEFRKPLKENEVLAIKVPVSVFKNARGNRVTFMRDRKLYRLSVYGHDKPSDAITPLKQKFLRDNFIQTIKKQTKPFALEQLSFAVEVELGFYYQFNLQYYYRPANVPLSEWKDLSDYQRAKRGFERCSPLTFETDDDDAFEFISSEHVDDRIEIPFLPQRMACDWPGTPEINDVILPNLNEYVKFLTNLKRVFGSAGYQGHVVFPKKYLPGMLGYQLYESDRSFFRRTRDEYVCFLESGKADLSTLKEDIGLAVEDSAEKNNNIKDTGTTKLPSWIPGDMYRADAVAPIRKQNWDYYKRNISLLKQGKELEFVGLGAGKCGAPNLRETYKNPGLIGFELRMEDNPGKAPRRYELGVERLIEATKRIVHLLTTRKDLSVFSGLENTIIPSAYYWHGFRAFMVAQANRNIDLARETGAGERSVLVRKQVSILENHLRRLDTWHTFLQERAVKTKELSEKLAHALNEDTKEELRVEIEKTKSRLEKNYDAFFYKQNFLYPLRAWEKYPVITENVNAQAIMDRVILSTLGYLNDVFEIVFSDFGKYPIPIETVLEINARMQIAGARWVHDVDLYPVFREFERKNGIPSFEGPTQPTCDAIGVPTPRSIFRR